MRLALQQGYDTLEAALLEASRPESHSDDAWRHNQPPAMPPLSPEQALQLLYLHQKEARLWGTPEPMRRRPGEDHGAICMRLSLIYQAKLEREREKYRVAEAARAAAREAPGPHEPAAPVLPDLAQVTGWSKARGKAPHHAGVALFGGWRLGDIKKK